MFIYFFFDPYEQHMDLCNELCSAGQPAILHGENFNVGHYTQTFQPNLFIRAILIDTIEFYHFH